MDTQATPTTPVVTLADRLLQAADALTSRLSTAARRALAPDRLCAAAAARGLTEAPDVDIVEIMHPSPRNGAADAWAKGAIPVLREVLS